MRSDLALEVLRLEGVAPTGSISVDEALRKSAKLRPTLVDVIDL